MSLAPRPCPCARPAWRPGHSQGARQDHDDHAGRFSLLGGVAGMSGLAAIGMPGMESRRSRCAGRGRARVSPAGSCSGSSRCSCCVLPCRRSCPRGRGAPLSAAAGGAATRPSAKKWGMLRSLTRTRCQFAGVAGGRSSAVYRRWRSARSSSPSTRFWSVANCRTRCGCAIAMRPASAQRRWRRNAISLGAWWLGSHR